MKAAVGIDKWKKDIFTKHLDGGGFEHTAGHGPTIDTLILSVQYDQDDQDELERIMQAAAKEADETGPPTRVVTAMPTPEEGIDGTPTPPHGGVSQWFIEDQLSHPLWDQYIALLSHLRPVEGLGNPVLHGDYGYEWYLFAIDPDHPLPEVFKGFNQAAGIHVLTPMNYGYQFNANNDAEAMEKVEWMLGHAISLDTDYRTWWNQHWPNAFPLVNAG